MLSSPSRTDETGTRRSYIRFVALGDSATFGIGDQPSAECRGWARLLVKAMSQEHDISFLNVAVPGARAADVRYSQLRQAVDHGPHLASLIVGINDTLHADWNATQVRHDLLNCAERLNERGTVLMTARFHDPSRIFRLPRFLARPLQARIAELNAIYDEIQSRFGGVCVDLSTHPGVYDREFWSADRLHPSELGHRALADEFAAQLAEHGVNFDPPGLAVDGPVAGRVSALRTVITEVIPWVGRRVVEFAPFQLRPLT